MSGSEAGITAHGRPTIWTDDEAFVDLVEQLVADEATTIGDLQTALRGQYPQAVVHLREISAERVVVWYVYRDGRWIGPGRTARG